MAQGNWVKPGTEPWPSPGEQYPGPGGSGGGMEAAERMGEIWVIWGPGSGQPQLSFVLRSIAVTNITRLSFSKLSGGFHDLLKTTE